MSALPSLELDTSLLPASQRLAAWRDAIPQYRIDPEEGSEDSFGVLARAWFLGDLVVTHTMVTAVTLSRNAQRIQMDGADTYNLNVSLRGSGHGDADGRCLTVGPGQLVGYDLSRPFTLSSTPSECVSVVIGRSALQDAVRGEPHLHGHIFEGAAGLLLSDHCLALARHLPAASAGDAGPIAQSILTLLKAALPSSQHIATAGDASQARIRREVRRYVDRNIGSADLNPGGIGQALHLSRATLYRSFQSDGGVAAFIQKRRLLAVRALLLHPSETRTISDIAQSLGFTDGSHLATAFRREFGCSPRELRTSQRISINPRQSKGSVGRQFQAWLADLG